MYLIVLISFKKTGDKILWQKQEVTPVKRVLETPGFLYILKAKSYFTLFIYIPFHDIYE